MPKNKKRKNRSGSWSLKLSEPRYKQLLLILTEAWEASDQGKDVFWDFGQGERPQKIIGEFQHVAKKESIPVRIANLGSSLRLSFPKNSQPVAVRIKSKSGEIKAQVISDGMISS